MFRVIIGLYTLTILTYGSLFTISDPDGTVLYKKELQQTQNEALKQKATEYSLQAIYDELQQVQRHARMAEAARQRALRIAKAKKEAQQKGKTYQLSNIDKQQLLEDAKYFKGGRYVWGGTTPQGFDCSGYVQYLYKKHNVNLPRTAWAQSKKGLLVNKKELQKGDLLFFLTDKKRGIPITHVGIYIGNGEFIHAASKKDGIIISPITHGSYAKTFVSARRVIQSS